MRKVLVIIFFIVVFGFPVAWYLTLQIFGENRFELPVLRTLEELCIKEKGKQGYILIDSLESIENPNLTKRLNKKLKATSDYYVHMYASQCLGEQSMLLVDSSENVRGEFVFSREEIDRLFAEMDIYITNIERRKNK